MDINLLVNISARAWSLSILALMHEGVPGRQVALLNATGASRTAFSQSLAHLVDLDLVERNPGHGHPLRPEFRLTIKGQEIAKTAHRMKEMAPQTFETTLLRRAWTVPILAVSKRPRFFSELKTSLPSITDRALSQSLKMLQANHWLSRRVDPAIHPPRALYQASNAGAAVSAAIDLSPS